MAQNPAVHIELRDDAWIVLREGNQRATSVHPTQSEAAESGRELARRDGAEFFLHGQDGHVREHHDYRGEDTSENEDILDTALGTVGTVTDAADGITSTAAHALGIDASHDPAPAREEPAVSSGKSDCGRHCRRKLDRPEATVMALPSSSIFSITSAPSGSLRTMS